MTAQQVNWLNGTKKWWTFLSLTAKAVLFQFILRMTTHPASLQYSNKHGLSSLAKLKKYLLHETDT